nr:FAD binding domain-containing protein [Cohnella fermenti]
MSQEELLRSPAVWQPRSPEEAASMKTAFGPDAVYAAGSTLLRTQWEAGTATMPRHLIDLGRVAGLKGITEDGAETVIGPMTTLTECRTSERLAESAPILVEAVKAIAGWSVRNLATLGGNVVFRVGDSVPALIALNASLEWLEGSRRVRTSAEEWAAAPSSASRLLTSIRIPGGEAGARANAKRFCAYHKVGRREAFTPSLVTIAIQGTREEDGISSIRIAAGGGQTTPVRMTRAEELLLGGRPDANLLQAVYEAVLEQYEPKTDPFAADLYRKQTAANLVAAALWTQFRDSASKG